MNFSARFVVVTKEKGGNEEFGGQQYENLWTDHERTSVGERTHGSFIHSLRPLPPPRRLSFPVDS